MAATPKLTQGPMLGATPPFDVHHMQLERLNQVIAAKDMQIGSMLSCLAIVARGERCACPPIWDDKRGWWHHYDACLIGRIRHQLGWL